MSDEAGTRRRRHAEQTHHAILAAARRLFARRGYRATTVRDVARAAGVSPQTVYDSVGSKRALVVELNDVIDVEAGIPALAAAAATTDDPAVVLATPARVTRALVEQCGDIIRTSLAAAFDEPELAAVVAEGHRRHVGGATMVVGRLVELGALDPGTDLERAVETVAAVTDTEVALMLVDRYGWTPQQVEDWMIATLTRLVGL